MAMGTLHVTVPAVAAAIGVYFFNRNQPKSKYFEGGFKASVEKLVAEAKEEQKMGQMPKLAPALDGLDCFETLVPR